MVFVLFVRRKDLQIKVLHIMSEPPIVIHYSASLSEAARLMYDNRIGSIMVVDDRGTLVGILTERDLLRLVATSRACRDEPLHMIMTKNPVTIGPDASVIEALKKMREYGIRHLPVVDREGKPIGMVSVRDIIDLILAFTE